MSVRWWGAFHECSFAIKSGDHLNVAQTFTTARDNISESKSSDCIFILCFLMSKAVSVPSPLENATQSTRSIKILYSSLTLANRPDFSGSADRESKWIYWPSCQKNPLDKSHITDELLVLSQLHHCLLLSAVPQFKIAVIITGCYHVFINNQETIDAATANPKCHQVHGVQYHQQQDSQFSCQDWYFLYQISWDFSCTRKRNLLLWCTLVSCFTHLYLCRVCKFTLFKARKVA